MSSVWICSDLQLADPQTAQALLTPAIEDVQQLQIPLVGVWCLGDVLAGAKDQEKLGETADTIIQLFERLAVPVRYVMGNHDNDYLRRLGESVYPLHERVREREGWRTTESTAHFYFTEPWCGYQVYFFSDQGDPAGEWVARHSHAPEKWDSGYPGGEEVWQTIRSEMASSSLPVITLCHYAFPGGQRPSRILQQLLPLPDTVCTHLFGHAHIGDMVWNKDCPWEREHDVKGQNIKQYNISALEFKRSPGSHSAFLTFKPDGGLGLRIRCHLKKQWEASYDISCQPVR